MGIIQWVHCEPGTGPSALQTVSYSVLPKVPEGKKHLLGLLKWERQGRSGTLRSLLLSAQPGRQQQEPLCSTSHGCHGACIFRISWVNVSSFPTELELRGCWKHAVFVCGESLMPTVSSVPSEWIHFSGFQGLVFKVREWKATDFIIPHGLYPPRSLDGKRTWKAGEYGYSAWEQTEIWVQIQPWAFCDLG